MSRYRISYSDGRGRAEAESTELFSADAFSYAVSGVHSLVEDLVDFLGASSGLVVSTTTQPGHLGRQFYEVLVEVAW